MSWHSHVQREDLSLSGPSVWPKLVADGQYDLFIFRRPELGYVEALRRIRRKDEREARSSEHVQIRIERARQEGKSSRLESSKTFWHKILGDPTDDVRAFLLELRRAIALLMPEGPDPSLSIRIQFSAEDGAKMIKIQDRWL